ncbi:hypothetical protein KR018_008289 [Drosophila ironensis]|nr:hypothetical protein KR018_008289 [Drosophila ironensis]
MSRRGNMRGGGGSPSRVPGPHQERRLQKSTLRKNVLVHNTTERTVTNRRPKYLPNLRALQMPHSLCEHSDRFVLISLSENVYPHDAKAALELATEKCQCFDLPRALFPSQAPLGRITFLPPQLLPPGFDAAGVFAAGVLSRKFYPIGLMGMQQKGQTPPLFVGRRSLVEVPSTRHWSGKPPPMPPAPMPLPSRPLAVPVSGRLKRKAGQNSVAAPPEMGQLLLMHDVVVAKIIPTTSELILIAEYLRVREPPLHNLYVPDLSNLEMVVPRASRLITAILSTVMQPHISRLVFAEMDIHHVRRFDLPDAIFPFNDVCRRPIFLPPKYLPRGFDAGCVYRPGCLSATFFQGPLKVEVPLPQFNNTLTPPVFVGLCARDYPPKSTHETILERIKQLKIAHQNAISGYAGGDGRDKGKELPPPAVSVPSTSAYALATMLAEKIAEAATGFGAYGDEAKAIEDLGGGEAAAADADAAAGTAAVTAALSPAPATATTNVVVSETAGSPTYSSSDSLDFVDSDCETVIVQSACSFCQARSPSSGTLEFVESGASSDTPVHSFNVDGDIDAIGRILEHMRDGGIDLRLKRELGEGFNYEKACEQFREMMEHRDEIRARMAVPARDHEERMSRNKQCALRRLRRTEPQEGKFCHTCGRCH